MRKHPLFEMRTITEIPKEMARAFALEQNADSDYMRDFIFGATLRRGVFRGSKLVGFYCGSIVQNDPKEGFPLGKSLELNGAYVLPEYRRQGIYRLYFFPDYLKQARDLKVDQIIFWGLIPSIRRFFRKQSISPRRQKDFLRLRVVRGSSPGVIHGHLQFPPKMPDIGRAAKRHWRPR